MHDAAVVEAHLALRLVECLEVVARYDPWIKSDVIGMRWPRGAFVSENFIVAIEAAFSLWVPGGLVRR